MKKRLAHIRAVARNIQQHCMQVLIGECGRCGGRIVRGIQREKVANRSYCHVLPFQINIFKEFRTDRQRKWGLYFVGWGAGDGGTLGRLFPPELGPLGWAAIIIFKIGTVSTGHWHCHLLLAPGLLGSRLLFFLLLSF